MFDTSTPSTQRLNHATFKDKVFGCWMGKNIGGTLGAPFEGKKETNTATFYTQELGGNPIPNDDLDLQLIWLLAVEERGLFNLNERILGEYWLTHIAGPWNEYGVCKSNIRNGLYPPLSGSCNNEKWKNSNGAWIRSEIWACLFPGSVAEAAQFAYYDACCDHSGDGIYAEIFTAVLESAAFIVSDVNELIKIGLAHIPVDCRIARSVNLAWENYKKGKSFLETREALVKDSEDLGWFQAPANIGYVVTGLLYGEGDFGKSICIANNCGDDTDCTAGTVGAILGIIHGRAAIPQKWTDPIGENIITCSIDTFGRNNMFQLPKNLPELTDAVVSRAISASLENPTLVQLTAQETIVSADYIKQLYNPTSTATRVLARSPYDLSVDFPFGTFTVNYSDGPQIKQGEEKKLTFSLQGIKSIEQVVSVRLLLPEDWWATPSEEVVFTSKCGTDGGAVSVGIVPGKLRQAYHYLPIELRLAGRFNPVLFNIPLQTCGSVTHATQGASYLSQNFWDAANRCACRRVVGELPRDMQVQGKAVDVRRP